jgi:hypothetical protein
MRTVAYFTETEDTPDDTEGADGSDAGPENADGDG